MCCVISCILKCVLGIVISFLMVIGIVLFVIGALLLWGFNQLLVGIYSIQGHITSFLSNFNVQGNGQDVMTLMANNASVIGAIGVGIGAVLVVFSVVMIVAMCCCSIRLILIVIVILLSAVTAGLIVLLAFYGSNPTGKIMMPLQNYLQTSIVNKYVGISGINAESILVNVIQITANCCGLYNYTDFNSAPNFNRTLLLSNGTIINMSFPLSCCDYKNDFTISPTSNAYCQNYQNSSKINNGCWTLVSTQLQQYLTYCFATIGITIGILVAVIVVLILFICCMEKLP